MSTVRAAACYCKRNSKHFAVRRVTTRARKHPPVDLLPINALSIQNQDTADAGAVHVSHADSTRSR